MHIKSLYGSLLLLICLTTNAEIILIKNSGQFEQEITNKRKPSVVKFYATWCGPCQLSKQPFQEISDNPDFDHITFAEVDTDHNELLNTKFNIEALPTFIFITGSSIQQKTVGLLGALTAEEFKNKLETTLHTLFPKTTNKNQQPISTSQAQVEPTGFWKMVVNLATGIIETCKRFFASIATTIRNLFT